METRAQIRVTNTAKISTAAKKLFLSPNCNGVNAKLTIRFKIKGITIVFGNFPVNAL